MSRRTAALLIVVLLILACCFSLALGLNVRQPTFLQQAQFSGSDLTRPAVADVRNRLTTQVRARDITVTDGAGQGCRIQGSSLVVPEDVTCRFGIPADVNQTRQLNLAVAAPTLSVESLLEQELSVSVDKQLVQGQRPYPYDIYRNENAAIARLSLHSCTVAKDPVGEGTAVPKAACTLKIGR